MFLANKAILTAAILILLLAGCGGGGGLNNDINNGSGSTGKVTYVPGVYGPEADFKNFCAIPRKGIDPYTNTAYPDKAGSKLHEQLWLRSWSNRTYLWYRELSDVNPAGYGVIDYFSQLKTSGLTDSGAQKDKFHFAENTADYLQQTESGVESGYGISWSLTSNVPPRKLTVAYIEPNSPAAVAGVSRGDEVRFIDGVSFVNENSTDALNKLIAGLYPMSAGEPHQFVMEKVNGANVTYNMVSADVEIMPVRNVSVLNTDIGKVGYLVFNSHIALAQQQLISAVKQFSEENIAELVIDLRYNGGGLLALASQLGYMVAGDNVIQNRFFETMQFNDKYPNTDPITGARLQPVPFYDVVIDYDRGVTTPQALPTLGLSRVFVITGDGTCSASEAFMNALRGVDLEVIQIGENTCGKPYGFYPVDNCGTTFFTVQFSGINAKGFGDYADGFTPTETPLYESDIKGCAVADDFSHDLGSQSEARLNTALYYAKHEKCPVVASVTQLNRSGAYRLLATSSAEPVVEFKLKPRNQLLDNRINMPIKPLE